MICSKSPNTNPTVPGFHDWLSLLTVFILLWMRSLLSILWVTRIFCNSKFTEEPNQLGHSPSPRHNATTSYTHCCVYEILLTPFFTVSSHISSCFRRHCSFLFLEKSPWLQNCCLCHIERIMEHTYTQRKNTALYWTGGLLWFPVHSKKDLFIQLTMNTSSILFFPLLVM